MTTVRVTLNHSEIRRILDRSATELTSWMWKVHDQIQPTTPIASGELRAKIDGKVVVEADKNVAVWWYWKAPYAFYVERMADFGRSPRAPGTVSPFAVPGVTKAARESLGGPIKRAFK